MDVLVDGGEDVQDHVGRAQQALRIAAIIARRLTWRERQVVQLRFGFGGRERMTQREIARLLKISRSYVSRIEKRAIRKVRMELQRSQDV